MRFLADESVDDPIVERLRSNGYGVDYIKELSPGIDDEAVLIKALDRNCIIDNNGQRLW
jgi:hypothetical protein